MVLKVKKKRNAKAAKRLKSAKNSGASGELLPDGWENLPHWTMKACLKTVEGVRWTMTKEERAQKAKRQKPTVSDPGGLL